MHREQQGIGQHQPAEVWLNHPEGRIHVETLDDGRCRLEVQDATSFVSTSQYVTSYPIDLIAKILEVKGASYLCDEIRRDEDPNYVKLFLEFSILGYVPEEAFEGARILDFGSGSGASTMVLGRLFPTASIVSVELEPDLIAIAHARAKHYGLTNVEIMQSPDSERLPEGIGEFDFINLSAVYEHLLPDERRRLLPQLWAVLKRGGVLFVSQLPHRYYFIEAHTTGLPLLNYFPAGAAQWAATRFSKRVPPDATWQQLLRRGIRGGTLGEIVAAVRRGGGEPLILRPSHRGLSDHADLWYAYSAQRRRARVKKLMRATFKLIDRVARTPFAPGLSVALEKRT